MVGFPPPKNTKSKGEMSEGQRGIAGRQERVCDPPVPFRGERGRERAKRDRRGMWAVTRSWMDSSNCTGFAAASVERRRGGREGTDPLPQSCPQTPTKTSIRIHPLSPKTPDNSGRGAGGEGAGTGGARRTPPPESPKHPPPQPTTTRNPKLPVLESSVLAVRAPTRYRLQ